MSKKKKRPSGPSHDFHSRKDLGPGCGTWPYRKICKELASKWEGKTKGFDHCRIPSPSVDLEEKILASLKSDLILNKKHPIKVKINQLPDGIWIDFLAGGTDVAEEEKKRERAAVEEKARAAAEEKVRAAVEDNLRRLELLEGILRRWEEEKQLPSSLWKDVTPNQLKKLKSPEPPRWRNVEQVYILELRIVGQYYVGRTSIGYPWRCFEHGYNRGRGPKYHSLKYKDDNYQKGMASDIMRLVNPIDKKFGCTHWMEWWLQKQMADLGFRIPFGQESSPITRENIGGGAAPICSICLEICTRIRDEFDEDIFDNFLN